jgi:hypothetical protein
MTVTYYPSNFILSTVGNDIETLTNALTFLQKGGRLHADGYVILPPKEEDNFEADPIVYSRVPALAFYAFGKPHNREGYVAKKMSAPTSISHFIYSWLEELEHDSYGPEYGGDGSSKKGWRLNVGYETCGVGEYHKGPKGVEMVAISDVYPDLDFYCFEFMIRPEWTFYAK